MRHPSLPRPPSLASGSKSISYGPPMRSSMLASGAKYDRTPARVVHASKTSAGVAGTVTSLRIGSVPGSPAGTSAKMAAGTSVQSAAATRPEHTNGICMAIHEAYQPRPRCATGGTGVGSTQRQNGGTDLQINWRDFLNGRFDYFDTARTDFTAPAPYTLDPF